ncbi:hypothetical protein AAG906_019703 [Vitis piasezkii]
MWDLMKLATQDDVNLAYEAASTHLIYPLTFNPLVFGHFFHLGSHFCKCEALCVLVSLTELEFRSRPFGSNRFSYLCSSFLCICSGLGIGLITSRGIDMFGVGLTSWIRVGDRLIEHRSRTRSIERDGLPLARHGFDSGSYNRGCPASCHRPYPDLGGSTCSTSNRAVTWEDFYGAPVASLSAKFRISEIERYTGIGCSRIHLRLYNQINMIMRSLQPRFARHLMRFPHMDFGFLVQALLISPHGDHIPRSVHLAFSYRHPATNNIIQDELKTRDVKLRPYHAYLELLVGRFDDLRYTHLPRVQNQFADALSTLASMIDIPIDTFLRLGAYLEASMTKDKRALRHRWDVTIVFGPRPADQVMREVHAGVCGPHMRGHMLAHKIMRTSYFWLTMETYCYQFVQRCPECQIHGDLIHVPPSELHALTSPWPFSVWGIDIIGKISPKSSSGHEFILVAIDYFTKWVEAASYEYISKQMLTLCYRDTVFSIIDRRIQKLPFALWAYRTSFCFSTSATLYFLVYGMEAVLLPVEIEMGSLRVALEPQIPEADWAQARLDQLNL